MCLMDLDGFSMLQCFVWPLRLEDEVSGFLVPDILWIGSETKNMKLGLRAPEAIMTVLNIEIQWKSHCYYIIVQHQTHGNDERQWQQSMICGFVIYIYICIYIYGMDNYGYIIIIHIIYIYMYISFTFIYDNAKIITISPRHITTWHRHVRWLLWIPRIWPWRNSGAQALSIHSGKSELSLTDIKLHFQTQPCDPTVFHTT